MEGASIAFVAGFVVAALLTQGALWRQLMPFQRVIVRRTRRVPVKPPPREQRIQH
jgi:hypothetical protein